MILSYVKFSNSNKKHNFLCRSSKLGFTILRYTFIIWKFLCLLEDRFSIFEWIMFYHYAGSDDDTLVTAGSDSDTLVCVPSPTSSIATLASLHSFRSAIEFDDIRVSRYRYLITKVLSDSHGLNFFKYLVYFF